jgi:hypothetical protein
VLNRRALTNVRDLEVRRGEIVAGALVWQPAVQVASGPLLERPTIACDPASGHFYISYTHVYLVSLSPETYSATIHFTRSVDGGATWSSPAALSPPTCNGSQVAVGPDGEVYVVWQDFATAQVILRRSLDHGASFGPAVAVGPILENVNTAPPEVQGIPAHIHTTWLYSLRVPHYPALAVDRSMGPRRGALYVAWPEMASGTTGPHLGNASETEPNEFFINASPAAIGQTLFGFTPSSDVGGNHDRWAFEGTAGQTVTLAGRFGYTPRIEYPNPGIAVFACDQDTLQPYEVTRTHGSDGSFDVPPLVFTLPRTGRYYITLATVGPYDQTYQLELRELQLAAGSVARDHRDIVLTSSGDGGQSWSPKVRLSAGAPRFDDILVALAVDDAGQVHAAWYGREGDPLCGKLADTYWTLSRNGGATFLPPQRVSSVSSSWTNPDWVGVAGDYLGLATVGTTAHVLWMDTRHYATSNSDIYGARIVADVATAVVVARFTAEPAASGIRLRWTIEDVASVAGFRLWRARGEGTWEELSIAVPTPGPGADHEVLDATAPIGERQRYRLEVMLRDGPSVWAGPVEVTLPPVASGRLSLRLSPNPSTGPVAVEMAVPRAGPVSLAIFDVAGKEVAQLHEGPAAAGVLQRIWEGRSREGHEVAPGLYWVRARANGEQVVQRFARVR